MSFYKKIVFGLKHHQKLYDCRTFIELVNTLCIIISEHNGDTDPCERPGLHYHGIIENGTSTNVNNNDAIAILKTYCAYFKIEKCDSPDQFVVDLAQPPKKLMVIEISKSVNLTAYYSKIPDFACIPLKLGQFENECSKMMDIELIIYNILNGRRIFDPMEIYKQIQKDNCYCSTPEELKRLVTNSIALVYQKILNQPILELCSGILKCPENYYTVRESTELVVEWCAYQNIDVKVFTMNWVKCLDKQVSYRNSLYFQGSSESGASSIIRSITDACIVTGLVENEITGYAYVWEECLEKRCIIMQDPVFDEHGSDRLVDILRGNGTFVRHRQSIVKYLRPTPVIVISNENDRERDLYLQRLQNVFLESYVDLKPFLKLNNGSRLLHPDWLNVLYKCFSGTKTDSVVSCSEDISEVMESDSPFESSDEAELISPIASVSSTTPTNSQEF